MHSHALLCAPRGALPPLQRAAHVVDGLRLLQQRGVGAERGAVGGANAWRGEFQPLVVRSVQTASAMRDARSGATEPRGDGEVGGEEAEAVGGGEGESGEASGENEAQRRESAARGGAGGQRAPGEDLRDLGADGEERGLELRRVGGGAGERG